jgi:hypothetical protein
MELVMLLPANWLPRIFSVIRIQRKYRLLGMS